AARAPRPPPHRAHQHLRRAREAGDRPRRVRRRRGRREGRREEEGRRQGRGRQAEGRGRQAMNATKSRLLQFLAVALAAAARLAPRAPGQAMDPDQERARQLIVRIRRSMREVDALLLSGAQPAKAEKELAANQKRIEELLKETESKSQSVVQNLDELI